MNPLIQDVPLGQILERLIDYRGKTPVKSKSGVKLITAKVIKGGRIEEGNHEFIAEADYDSWMRRGLPQQRDILITTEAPLGELAMLRSAERIALAQRVILLRANAEVADQSYIFHALKSPLVQARLYARATGTTVLGIKQSELVKVEVPLPALATQSRIAFILSAYDDLIENNTRRIAILEEMARRIYEEWFVRFRFPGHEGVRMVESELGPMPEGWEVKRLSDEIELVYGKALKAEERVPGDVRVYGSSGVVGFHNRSLTSGPGIIVGRKGNVGSVHWSEEPFYAIDTVYFVKTRLPLYYVFFNLQRQNFLNNDAAVPGLNRNQAYSLPLLLPTAALLEEFDKLCGSLMGLARLLARKSANLRATRDLLLPKLISGELDVSEISTPEAIAA